MNLENIKLSENNNRRAVNRKFIFEYYQVYYYFKENNLEKELEGKYNLKPLINYIDQLQMSEKKVDLSNGQFIRLEKLFVKSQDILVSTFIRFKEDYLSSKGKIDSPATSLNLDDDEYLGNDMSILYDESLNVLMMQRNRNSLSKNNLELYLNYFVNNIANGIAEDIQICLLPIVPKNIQKKIMNSEYVRGFNIKLSEFNNDVFEDYDGEFKELITIATEYDAHNIEVILNVGKKQNVGLKKSKIKKAISSICDFRGKKHKVVPKTKFKIKEDEESRVEEVDLFTDKLSSQIFHWVNKDERLYSTAFFSNIILEKYIETKGEILKCINMDS